MAPYLYGDEIQVEIQGQIIVGMLYAAGWLWLSSYTSLSERLARALLRPQSNNQQKRLREVIEDFWNDTFV